MKTTIFLLLLDSASKVSHLFIQQEEGRDRTLYVVLIIVGFSLAGRLISSWIANRSRQQSGRPPIHGPLGGTICPNCKKPYALHLWSIKLLFSRIDRCPHCGAWKVVKRYPPNVLEASSEAMRAIQKGEATSSSSLSPEEQLRKKLDDSRFDDL